MSLKDTRNQTEDLSLQSSSQSLGHHSTKILLVGKYIYIYIYIYIFFFIIEMITNV